MVVHDSFQSVLRALIRCCFSLRRGVWRHIKVLLQMYDLVYLDGAMCELKQFEVQYEDGGQWSVQCDLLPDLVRDVFRRGH